LLPRWRGAAPIQRAILAGDEITGVTIMQMNAGLDTGYMLITSPQSISQTDTTGSLEGALAQLGAQALLEALALLQRDQPRGKLRGQAQPAEGVTYASKVQKEEARLDFALPAQQLDRVVRAFNPAPIAFTTFRRETLRVWRAEPAAQTLPGAHGTLHAQPGGGVAVACGGGALLLREVQRPGGKPLDAAAWAAGVQLKPGERLGV
jgi:methionyl-tRNA formyltransferase